MRGLPQPGVVREGKVHSARSQARPRGGEDWTLSVCCCKAPLVSLEIGFCCGTRKARGPACPLRMPEPRGDSGCRTARSRASTTSLEAGCSEEGAAGCEGGEAHSSSLTASSSVPSPGPQCTAAAVSPTSPCLASGAPSPSPSLSSM